jgi:hypothetical protein
MASTHERRRKIRAAEAKRDQMIIKKEQVTKELAKARLELKQARKSK